MCKGEYKDIRESTKLPQFKSQVYLFNSCVTLGVLLSFSVCQFSYLQNGDAST